MSNTRTQRLRRNRIYRRCIGCGKKRRIARFGSWPSHCCDRCRGETR